MRPGSRFLTWLDTRPAGTDIAIHNIMGDLGEGNDGLIAVESARLAGVTSELVLSGNHSYIYKSSAAVVELRRILDLHLQRR